MQKRAYGLALLIAATPGGVAGAQGTYRVSLGIEESARRNPAQSPYVYSGWGWAGTFGYARAWSSSALDASLRAAAGSLSSGVSGSSATRWSGSVALGYLRRVPRRFAGAAWEAGASVDLFSDIAQHHYARLAMSDEFGYATLGASPVARGEWRVGGISIINRLSVPLANVVLFPYANAKMAAFSDARFASPSSVRGFDESISYRAGPPTSRSLTWTYRLSWLRYVSSDTRTFAQQSLSLQIGMPRSRRGK